ncbi:MAG TPA: YjbQ family protein, partial [Candidatus Saccharimonadia bacterium]|nr:YjbQ family protein [Candidatus Saccharimonadia bacterium]
MSAHADQFTLSTRGKGTYDITSQVERIVRAAGIKTGTATVFVQHTSCSLVIYENAD